MVGCGILNAGYTTFGDKLSDTVWFNQSNNRVDDGARATFSSHLHCFIATKLSNACACWRFWSWVIDNWTIGFERLPKGVADCTNGTPGSHAVNKFSDIKELEHPKLPS